MSLRADAQRNRALIIATAKRMFTEFGPEVPLEDIARAAGVGIGTLYRRFPDRTTLLREVMRDNFRAALDEACNAIEEESSYWSALARFMHISEELRLSIQLSMVHPETRAIVYEDSESQHYRGAILERLKEIVHGAQHEGRLRTDIDTGDIAMFASLLIGQVRREWTPITRFGLERAIAILLDGLRAERSSELPGRAISVEELERPPG